MAPKKQDNATMSDKDWMEMIVQEAVKRTRVASLISALQAEQANQAKAEANGSKDSGAKAGGGPAKGGAPAEAAQVGKICKSCGLELPKEQFSAKQWKLGAERRCIACVAKAGSDESAWTTVGAADGKDPKK